jgi:hypothetical protein
MGFKAGFEFSGQKELSFNACVFATRQEAEIAGDELLGRWFLPDGYNVIEVDEKVNYTIVNGKPKNMAEIAVEVTR